MVALIISCLALAFSIIALIEAFRKEKPIELKINDDLSGIKKLNVKCKGVELHDSKQGIKKSKV